MAEFDYETMQGQIEGLCRSAKEAFDAVPKPEGRDQTISKHTAVNRAQLKETVAIADQQCPLAADTIRWLLWWNVLTFQTLALLNEDLPQKREHSTQGAG